MQSREQCRDEIIDTMTSYLKDAGEDHNEFFRGIDIASLDEFQLETCANLVRKVISKPTTNASILSTAFALKNGDGQYYNSQGYRLGQLYWVNTIGQARIYPSISTARRACKYFNKHYIKNNQYFKLYQHIRDVEVVAINMADGGSVDPSQDSSIKKDRKAASAALAQAQAQARAKAILNQKTKQVNFTSPAKKII